jgi:hypothetical protein
MPASTIAETRSTLASAFNALAATSYGFVPEAPIPPAIVVVPSTPYMETSLGLSVIYFTGFFQLMGN